MPIIILDTERETLYGHDTLERVVANGKAETVFLVEGIRRRVYLAFLVACFSDHQSVSRLQGNEEITPEQLERISDSIEITEEHLEILRRY
jgi:hypothetical protein